jgi:hypothetical protein
MNGWALTAVFAVVGQLLLRCWAAMWPNPLWTIGVPMKPTTHELLHPIATGMWVGSENPYQGRLAGDTESLGQKSAGIFAKYQENLNL